MARLFDGNLATVTCGGTATCGVVGTAGAGRLRRTRRTPTDSGSAPGPDSGPVIGDETARRVMSSAVEDQVATNGATVVLDGAQGVILGYRRRTAHAFHAAMTLVTAGLWAPVWILSSLRPGEERIRLSVDAWGHVWATPVASP